MTRLRTSLITVGAGTALLATGAVVASSATATPAPVAAVEQLGVDATPVSTAADAAPGGVAARGWWKKLTDEQRTCLQDQRITRPVGPLDDTEKAALRAKVEAAAEKCQVTLPFQKARTFWNDLSDAQRSCLKDAAGDPTVGPPHQGAAPAGARRPQGRRAAVRGHDAGEGSDEQPLTPPRPSRP